jgi:hypothetical protein
MRESRAEDGGEGLFGRPGARPGSRPEGLCQVRQFMVAFDAVETGLRLQEGSDSRFGTVYQSAGIWQIFWI